MVLARYEDTKVLGTKVLGTTVLATKVLATKVLGTTVLGTVRHRYSTYVVQCVGSGISFFFQGDYNYCAQGRALRRE